MIKESDRSKQVATACPLDCADACGALVEVDEQQRFVRLRGNPAHSYSRGSLCGKTADYGELVHSPDRLSVPLVRQPDGAFAETSWDDALELVAARLSAVPGEEILALAYAGCMGLVNRHFPMRLMHALGATETDGGVCDNTATAGYECVLGRVIGGDIEDVRDADFLLIWGADIKRTVQHLQPAIQDLCRRGVPVVAIDVYRTDTIRALESWGGEGFVLRPGTDAALALALTRLAFEHGSADEAFLQRECAGEAEFRAHVMAGHDVAWAAEITGLAPAAIHRLAKLCEAAQRPFIKAGVGFTRRRNGAMSMRAVASFAAVIGAADRFHYQSFEHFGFSSDVTARPDLRARASKKTCRPIQHVAVGRHLARGDFRAVVVWGHNPAESLPDSFRVRQGLARDDLFVVVHEQFMTATALLADVVLPATTMVEQTDVYRSYGHRVMQYGKKACAAPASQRSNVDTFRALAQRFDFPPELRAPLLEVDEEGLCRELLEAHRDRFGAGELDRIMAGEPVKLAPRSLADRGTPSGKIELVSDTVAKQGGPRIATYVPDDGCGGSGAFWLVSAPSRATHNTTYGYSSRHVRRAGAPLCHLNLDDASRLKIEPGSRVRLTSEQGSLTFEAAHSPAMPAGMVRVDGFPRPDAMPEGVSVNGLTSPLLSDLGEGNVLYSARVDVAPA